MYKIGMILIVLMNTLFAQKVLTSQEAIQIALNKNTALQKVSENIKVSESNLKAAYGNFLPSVSASAGWNWSQLDNKVNGTDFSTTTRNYSLGANANWTIFDGLANFAGYQGSQDKLEAAKLSLARAKQEIVFQTLSMYYGILNAQKLLQVKEDDLKWNQKNYEIIVERNKLGAVTLADVYASQVKVGNAELALAQANNSFETQKTAFLYYLGLDVLESYQFAEPVLEQDINLEAEKAAKDYENLSNSIEQALKYRPDYQSKKYELNASYESLKAARAGHLPSLNGNAGFSFGAPKMGDMFDNKTYSAGLTLSVPIFSGWGVENRIEASTVDAKIKEIDLSDALREIKRDVQKNYLNIQAAFKQVEVGRKNVTAAHENRRIEEEKYTLGATTLLNVLIANSEYTNAITNHINAQFEYRKLKDELQYLIGKSEIKSAE